MKADLMLHFLQCLRRDGLRRVIALGIMAVFLAQSAVAAAPGPSWWTTQGVLNAEGAKDDYTLANVGQLKAIAKKAAAEMHATLGTEGTAIASMIAQWDAALVDEVTGADYTVLNIGMLKNVASLFYDQLRAHHNDPVNQPYAYPWPVVKKTGGATTSGGATVTLATTSGLAAGMQAYGPGIPAGATISSFTSGTQLVLSANATATATGLTCLFTQPGAGMSQSGGTTVAGTDTLTLAATASLRAGMSVFGPGLPEGTRVQSIQDSTHLTLSQAAETSGSGQSFFFYVVDDYSLVNLGQLKNVFSFAMASFVGDPAMDTLPGATLSEVRTLWDSLPTHASGAERDYDSDGDGIPDLQEYLMNHGRTTPLALLYANDLDGDRIPNAVEDLWNGDGTPAADVAPLLLNKLVFADAVKDADGDGVMNFEEIALGLNLRATTTTPRDDGLSDNQVLAWSLLHRTVSLPEDPTTTPPALGTDAIKACWDQIILTPGLLGKYGLGSHTNWLVETDGADSNSTPDGLDDFRAEAPTALASFLDDVSTTGSTDHDGDGMSDEWEYRYALNLRLNDAALDTDGDTLTNFQEYDKRTNPRLKDSDGDGYDDYAEVTYGVLASNAVFANEKPPVRLTLISSSSQNIFLGMRSDALTVRVHKGGIPKTGVNVTFQITDNTPARGTLLSGRGGVFGTGTLVVPTDSNGMAVAYFVGTRTGAAPIKASMDSSNYRNISVNVDAPSPLLTNTSGNYVNFGGDGGEEFSQVRNQAEQNSTFSTTGPGPDGVNLQMQVGVSTEGDYKKQAKASFYAGGLVAMDKYSPVWQYRQHSIITLEATENAGPNGGGVTACRTYVVSKVTGKDYWKYALGGEGDFKIEVLGAVTFNEAGSPQVTKTTSVDWIKPKGSNALEITPPEAGKEDGSSDYYVVFSRVDIVPAEDMSGVIGDVVKSSKAGSTIKHFVTPKQTSELDQPDVILVANGIYAAQITDGDDLQIVKWDGGEEVPGEPLKRKVSRNSAGPAKEIKIIPKGKSAAATQMNVWVVWANGQATQEGVGKITPAGQIPTSEITIASGIGWTTDPAFNQGAKLWKFKFVISPSSLFSQESPDLKGKADPAFPPPGGAKPHPADGFPPLANGVMNKWDVTRNLQVRIINPGQIPANKFPWVQGVMFKSQPKTDSIDTPVPENPVEGNDDTGVNDEENNPYKGAQKDNLDHEVGQITSMDAPTFLFPNAGGVNGDTIEIRAEFKEFCRLQIGNKWYRISDYVPWRCVLKIIKENGVFIDNGSETTLGH